MARSKVGIKDVAVAAGVSVGTVSNVVNRPEVVAAATRVRVQSVIDELGYVRDGSARQLRSGTSRTMALLVLDLANPFFVDVARGAEQAAQVAGLQLITCNSGQRVDTESAYLAMLTEQRVRGVLLSP
ncbi:MAG: LacI family DNA-binding transcriptional regulator, partial [Streptosporangiales bacterium]|nr:LacI family DNA-binding transcriptional regulator [Streptosporangiales bacterium]